MAIQKVTSYPFNMYYTDKFSGEMEYDCLRYTVLDDIVSYGNKSLLQHQFILYCFRPIQDADIERENKTTVTSNENARIFSELSFEQLKIQNISTVNLFTWSAPLDLVERYAAYLIDNTDVGADTEDIFLNCTVPWFGPRCQYTFETTDSFSTMVKSNFEERTLSNKGIRNQNTTCYIHLNCTHRSWAPLCLDWREVCDGKVDCINDGTDEQHCFELEKNECEENEYRCQNGLCIPQEFLRDDAFNPECLDQTDEGYHVGYSFQCPSDPSFRCEEHTCKSTGRTLLNFPCGDGECSPYGSRCNNGRGSWLQTMRTSFESHELCWMAMYCLTIFQMQSDDADCKIWCTNITAFAAQNIIRKDCPPIFDFPNGFRLYGHVRLLYTNNNTVLIDSNSIIPAYVCYEKNLCDFLSPTINLTISNNETVTCRRFQELNLIHEGYVLGQTIFELQKLFHACYSIDNSIFCENETTSLFHCPNSRKCISKHRLLDAVRDCGGDEDESYGDSCDLNDKYRFKCEVDGRCIVSALVRDNGHDCAEDTDEKDQTIQAYEKQISFQTLCDGFVELAPLMINGSEETDETDCEHWLCNNTYTRCDGFWNCPNGADEVNCHSMPICPPSEHICISTITHNITCLPIDKANDDKFDCFGGTDERYYCRKKYPKAPSQRFLCQNIATKCIFLTSRCNGDDNCPSGEDEQFCWNGVDVCHWFWDNRRTVGEELLCQLDEEKKPKTVYFSLKNFPNYSSSVSSTKQSLNQYKNGTSFSVTQTVSHIPSTYWPSRWRCNRGLNIRLRQEYKCLCPPSYYGDLCEYQNQRVSLTIRVRTEGEWRVIFAFLITLIDDNEHIINFYDQFNYIGIRDCNTKFNMYLLYATRPKDTTKNYSIRIDAFDRYSFTHRASWLYPLHFIFLPVHRIAVHLIIPWMLPISDNCKLKCIYGRCIHTVNDPKNTVCQCDHGWSGKQCHIKEKCNCSPQSLCMGSVNNRSICLCPSGTFGSRCFLTQSICQSQPCHNGGQCIPNDFGRKNNLEYVCVCNEGYSGDNCQRIDTRIEISFQSNIKIPSSVLAHLITINVKAHPIPTTLFKKIGFNQNSAILFTHIQFRLIFIQFDEKYYFAFHQSTQAYWQNISTVIIPSHRCLSINELFNSTIVNYHNLRRLKYYHLPCQEHSNLVCFYDSHYMCLCTTDRHADCFKFDLTVIHNCQGQQICKNGAECFDNDPLCPTVSTCVCKDCFYGSRCQYSTKGFDLSLDIILGYHIEPNLGFSKQRMIVKVSTALVVLMSITGLISGIFSILTFRAENSQKVGCGVYLLATSIISILLVIMFSWKMFFLIASHMGLITRRSFLSSNCVMIDFFLRVILSASDWLSACVATERAVAIIKGPYFDLAKSKRVSKYVIVVVIPLVIVSVLPDSFHRELVDDLEDSNASCVINYSYSFALLNSIILVFHFLVPFIINIISALLIIIMTARQRSTAQKQLTRTEHLRDQFQQHKHLLISPCILVVLGLPRLIMSFLSGCMNSTRDSWFFLFGYFISFIPPILTFFVFVLPSKTYKSEFLLAIKRR